MGSRRTVNHSLTGSGRPLNGSDVSGNSRLPGCSYLSNVRPENRSTLCSVIAQLTEETQPFFEVTLKSKAVSQSSSAKFTCAVTGHPTPQVTWYKDDIQLDRYCGLPKYEIFRNGPNHSLHIYHCTEEDAAIYQASATNTKGIVSCSGVLEVGEMNEFKIHQRYFSKLKQKAENKRKEAEEKENHEPTRTISPDRTQRKRRSTVGGYISAPSSTEDDTSDESQQEAAAGISEVSSRVQESSVEAFTYTNGTVESIEPRLSTDRDTKEDTPSIGTHDSAQKVVTGVPQTKTPLIKKSKINSAKASSEEKKTHHVTPALLRLSLHVNRSDRRHPKREQDLAKKVGVCLFQCKGWRRHSPMQSRRGMRHLLTLSYSPSSKQQWHQKRLHVKRPNGIGVARLCTTASTSPWTT
uniref:non-specific serine/threonine protein kinase n=1 Tax=Knipowitschia caucasica TaxID=637954 RepID=A0AAV2LP97_KNICA